MVGIAVITLVAVLLLAQNRKLSQDIKTQTAVNQQYLRCIILLPKEAYATIESRVQALDKCAEESQKGSRT